MPPTYISLAAGTGGQLANTTFGIPAIQRKTDISPKIWFTRGELSPFLHLSRTGFFRRRRVVDPKYQQFEQAEHETTFKMTVTLAAQTNLTLTVDASAQLSIEDRIMPLDGSGQVARITAIGSATQISVTWYTANGTATTTITAIADDTFFQNLGNASKEGSTLRKIVQPQVAANINFTETMRYPFGGTRHRLKSELWTGRGMEHMARQEWIRAKRDIEYKLMWGVPTEQVINSTTYRTTGGLYYWITKKSGFVHSYAGNTFSRQSLVEDLLEIFSHGSDTRVLVANPKLLSVLDRFKDFKLNMYPGDMIYNMKVNWLETNEGRVMVVRSLGLEMPNSYGTGTMKAMGFFIDPEFIDYTFFDQDLHIVTNRQANDYDGTIHEIMGDVGLAVNVTQAHAVIHNIGTVNITLS